MHKGGIFGFVFLCFFFSLSFGSVESYRNSLFIFLSDKGGSSNPYVKSGIYDYVSTRITGDIGNLYLYSIDVSSRSASDLSSIFSNHESNSVFAKALEYWFENSSDSLLLNWKNRCGNKCALTDLKKIRPDILPLRYIVISEGVSGLVAREYIQGSGFVGDISKVLFFDTPHEGTGFADQTLFQGLDGYSLKKPDVKNLSALIPLTLSAYVFGGLDALQDAVMSVTKSAVLGMAQNAGNISTAFSETALFDEYAKNSDALWYLAQDASFDDKKYADIIAASKAEVKANIGEIQWLNSTGMKTGFSSPSYGIVYSYGFPTVGNGRRTYNDFGEQVKNHIPKEKLKQVFVDSLKNVLLNAGIDGSDVKESISNLADELLKGELSSEGRKILGEFVEKYQSLGNALDDSKLFGYIQGLSELRSLKINMDDLPGSALKILRVLEKFIPEAYKSELYSVFIENFSPEIADVLGSAANCAVSKGASRNCVLAGLSVSAKNLSNYGLNFFDEGIFDVPVYSAYGLNVSSFKNASVSRVGYDLGDYIENNSRLKEYKELLANVGRLETVRNKLDVGLRVGCNLLMSPYDEICKAAAFAANVVLIADMSGKTAKLAQNIGTLKDNKHLSLSAAVKKTDSFSYDGLDGKISFDYPDLEKLLFDSPKISMASIFKKGNEDNALDSIIPLMLFGTCESDVYDVASLENNCQVIDNGERISKDSQNVSLYASSFAEENAVSAAVGDKLLSVKDIRFNADVKQSTPLEVLNYWKWKAPTVRKYIYEYHFVVDDLQPDSLRQIMLDFNAGVRMAYERKGESWEARLRIGGGEWSKAVAVSNPVRSDGLFVFRPKEFFDLGFGGEEHLLSSIQKEGPNMVNLYVVNKLGMTGTADFTYLFESTPPLLEQGWPRAFATLSRIDNPYIYFNKQDGVPNFSDMSVSLICFDTGNEHVGNANAKYELIDETRGTYKISADIESLWSLESLRSGNYILEWNVGILDDQNKRTSAKLRTMVYIDRDVPDIELSLKQKDISGKNIAGSWGAVLNNGSVSDRGLRALRIFAEKSDGSTIPVKSIKDNSEQVVSFGWQEGIPDFEGNAKLIVQAIDYAYPSEEFENLLADSIKGDESLLWDKLTRKNERGNYVFADGFNGTHLETEIVIDTTAPMISDNSLVATVLHGEQQGDKPPFIFQDDKMRLGINDTLKFAFDIKEELFGRDSSVISVQLLFNDENHDIHKVYDRNIALSTTNKGFRFIEPDANRLQDGIYDVSIKLTDNVGNTFDTTIYKGLVVDRIAPVVTELMNGDVSFSDVSELRKSKAYVSQIADEAFNRTELSCYANVSVGEKNTGWFFVGKDLSSKNGNLNIPFDFSLQDKIFDLPNGLWTVRFGCFDGVGNYGEAVDFFGMGRRYPRITFPEEGMGDYFGEQVLIEGTTPNPIIKNRDDKNASFSVELCKIDLSGCSSENVSYLTRTVSEQPKALAIWNTNGLKGSYVIRLKVKGCDYREENCDSAITERIVSFADGIIGEEINEEVLPKLVLENFPKGQVPASDASIRLKLDGFDTSKWSMNVGIDVQSPKDSSVFVPAKNVFFGTVMASPFNGEPPVKKDGLSVWQIGKTWNVFWKGKAESSAEAIEPQLSLKYQKETVRFTDSGLNLPQEDVSVAMPVIGGENIEIPAYNASRNWIIEGGEILIQFESDSAFIVDISSVKDGKNKIYCGKNSVIAGNVISMSKESPVLYVNPQQYTSNIVWNGLTQENLYPGGSEVRLHAYAYQKNDKTKLIFCESSWNQLVENFSIITNDRAMKEFYVGLSSDETNSENSFALSKFNFEFGIAGQPAYVSAEIIGPNGNVVRKLMDNRFLLAGTSKTAYSVSWDGMSETGFAMMEEGHYELKITAKRGDKEKTLSHEFELILANKLIPAPTEVVREGEFPAELMADEAVLDEMGNLRYYGNPDYLLKADVTAVTLPSSQREIEYHWTMDGVQHPVFFEKNRYSLGIHRHREKFSVTVAVLLVGYGHDLTSVYNWKNRSYNYKLFWKKIFLNEGEVYSFPEIALDPWNSIVGIDKDGDNKMEIGVAIKILPESAAKRIADHFSKKEEKDFFVRGHINHDSYSDPEEKLSNHNYTWNSIWNDDMCRDEQNKNLCPDDEVLKYWWDDLGKENVYWKIQKKTFYYDRGSFSLESASPSLTCKPSSSMNNNTNKKFVCTGDDYDVHKDMVKISISPTTSHDNYSYGNYNCFCENDGSNTNIAVQLKLEVKDKYWNPQYGYNNLANTFTRFDAENIALFDNEGYCNLQDSPCKVFDGRNWIVDKKEGKLTAFEAEELSMVRKAENPLLFSDEYDLNGELSESIYSVKFYNAKNAPVPFKAAITWNENEKFNRLDLNSDDVGEDSIVTPKIKDPLSLSFYVAPKMSVLEAAKSSKDIVTDYPFLSGDFSNIENAIQAKCDACKFYHGLASGLHFRVGDWNVENWSDNFESDGLIKNPLTATDASPRLFTSLKNLDSYYPERNVLSTSHTYRVKEEDSKELDYWKIPESIFLETKPNKDGSMIDNGNVPSGNFRLQITTPGWKSEENEGVWSAKNEGETCKSTASFIWSWQKPWNYNRNDLIHKISLDDVERQDSSDEILGKPWVKKVKIGRPYLYARGPEGESESSGERKLHSYYTAEYDDNEKQFFVTRGHPVNYNAREPEKLTLRGRVPGKDQKWNLFYVQNGIQHFLKSGIQDTIPVDKPYPILDYAEMNRLQGNTSFFLTYGGTKGQTYFRQLDMHVGTLLKSGEGGVAQSMYGEISVDFEPGTWGENDVDVMVRTIPKAGEYNFEAFKNLDVVGPVVEVLPSHDFSNLPDSLWPLIHVRLQCSVVNEINPAELKIFKPNFATMKITPLESQNVIAFDKNNKILAWNDSSFDAKCGAIEITAKTKSFSTFVVLDSESLKNIELADTSLTEKYELRCGEMPMDSLWMGTANGWLEYPYPCSGKSNYLLQLRSGSSVVAERQAASTSPIVWNVRKSDIVSMENFYDSRMTIYGVDGKTDQFRGPIVRMDSIAPVISDMEISVVENHDDRILQVDVSATDLGSGISKTRLDVYFGGNLLESRTVFGKEHLAENFVLNRNVLYGCIGCKATVNAFVEDYGHNYTKAALQSERLYPYPLSLALWYPLSEGAGTTAFEITGNGPNIDLSGMKMPWQNGKTLRLFAGDKAVGKGNMQILDTLVSFSIELGFSAGYSAGTVLGWQGDNAWRIGVDSVGRYYLETSSERVTFGTIAERNIRNHIVLTIDQNRVCLYKNGSFVENQVLSSRLVFGDGGKTLLGGIGSSKSIVGAISDVRIYRSVLTSSQVSDLYRDGLDLASGDILAVRAVTLERGNLAVDQSCGVAGKAYLRQRTAIDMDKMIWDVNAKAGRYKLYLLSLNYASEVSEVEVFVNGDSRGIYTVESTGFWKSVRVDDLTLGLVSGENRIAVRPIGNLGIAALALVDETKNLSAEVINYGEQEWKNPDARVLVQMHDENQGDVSWIRPKFRLKNLTDSVFSGARIRYYYYGEGSNVQATSFYPSAPMSVVPDAGGSFYGELELTESIPAYGTPYFGNGPQIGLHRVDYYFPWNTDDDPSYADGAKNTYVEAKGVALLDADGFLLNDWSCYDANGPMDQKRKSARVLAKDSKSGSNQSSLVTMLVENTGMAPIDGFEIRYYYRDDSGEHELDVYSSPFAEWRKIAAGGNLYYVSFLYSNTILNPGEKSDFGNGVSFEIHNPGWAAEFDASDDPSHYGLGDNDLSVADSALVLDLKGNLLWGKVPQPRFSDDFQTQDVYEDLIDIEGDVVYVNVSQRGTYTLETVNAAGMPLVLLFSGVWDEGEHSVSLANFTFTPGSYLVLRRGSEILSWKLFR